jgi:hypothetical protein
MRPDRFESVPTIRLLCCFLRSMCKTPQEHSERLLQILSAVADLYGPEVGCLSPHHCFTSARKHD